MCGALGMLVLVLLFATGCASTDESGSAEDAFLSQAGDQADFPDEDDVLLAIGHQSCVEVGDNGEDAAVANLDQSSFAFDQKLALSVSARQNLCPDE